MKKLLSSQFVVFALALALGIALAIWGAREHSDEYKSLLLSLGGALIGVGATGCLTSIEILNHWSQLHAIFGQLSESRHTSPEDRLKSLQQTYYHYYTTEVDGNFEWRCDIIDFAQPTPPGVLRAASSYRGRDGGMIKSVVDGFLVDTRLVILIKDQEHDEPADVGIYPSFTKPGLEARCGLEVRETLDHREIVCAGILVEQPIRECRDIGVVSPSVAAELTRVWQSGYRLFQFDGVLTLLNLADSVESAGGPIAPSPTDNSDA